MACRKTKNFLVGIILKGKEIEIKREGGRERERERNGKGET